MEQDTTPSVDISLAKKLVRDELFGMRLYAALRKKSTGHLATMLDELIEVETGHYHFWQELSGIHIKRLGLWSRLKLLVIVFSCRVFGHRATHLAMEAIEVYNIRTYLMLWERYRDTPVFEQIKDILNDELKHEQDIVAESERLKINPEKIRNIFLGFNDGLVEISGAVSGFFAAFASTRSILIAGFTVAVAGAISMAAGVFVSSGSENEIKKMEARKRAFLNKDAPEHINEHPFSSAFLVGIFYFLGALVPILPVLFGAQTIVIPFVVGAVMIAAISLVLAFISGMNIARRITINVAIIAVAVVVTYGIGIAAKEIFGVAL